MKKATETALVKACLQLLQYLGIRCWRNNTGARKIGKRFFKWGEVGSPDIIGIIPPRGRFLGVECKMPGNDSTDLQEAWGEGVRKCGALYVVVESDKELEEILRDEGVIL